MLDSDNWLKKTPIWVYWSICPMFGGLAIAYAGVKTKTQTWFLWGLGIFLVSITFSSYTNLVFLMWLSQISVAVNLRKSFLLKTAPRDMIVSDSNTAKLLAAARGQIDINSCSKDELVYELSLPIVYANNIESAREEGYIFTHLEELTDIAGIPEQLLEKIAPLIIFSYDINKEAHNSWRVINSCSVQDLMILGVKEEVASQIIQERDKKGSYTSLMDVKNRTGIPLSSYSHLR